MDWTTIIDGLYVSALGMGMVMAVLLLLAITVWVVSKLDRALEARQRSREQVDQPVAAIDVQEDRGEDENLANVAVIAVAIALAEEAEHDATPDAISAGTAAVLPTNDWLTQGRTRQRSRLSNPAIEIWKR